MERNVDSITQLPATQSQFIRLGITSDGQLFFASRDAAAKTGGEVLNTVFSKQFPVENQQEIDDVCKRDGQELPVQARVLVEYSQIQVDHSVLESLNWFDWEVMDAISTLYAGNYDQISLDSIYRVIIGKKIAHPVTNKQRQMISESIQKMRHIPIQIKIVDFFEEGSPIGAALQKLGFRSGTFQNYLIPCTIHEYRDQSNYDYYIKLLDTPPLFAYAKMLGLASLYPIVFIDTPVKKTRNIIILQSLLLRSIDQMYRDRDNGNDVSLLIKTKDIYSATDVETDTEKARIRKRTEQLLNFWIQSKYIDGFEIIYETRRKKVKGYHILLAQESRIWNLPEDNQAVLPAMAASG